MRTLGLIPARGGSTRVPGKNLMQIGGRPLVARALDCVTAAERVDHTVLSSDHPGVLGFAEGRERVLALPRPAQLASETALVFDVVCHALEHAEAEWGRFEAVALLQCTSPFTLPQDVDGCLELLERSGAASAVTVARVEGVLHPAKLKLLDGDRLRALVADDALTPSHALPAVWARNGSVYAARRETIERGLLVDDADCAGYEMPSERSHDIDTPLDLLFAEFLVARGLAG